YEKGFDFGQEQVLVVASSRASQIERLKARSGFDESLIDSILAAQLPAEDKIRRADLVFWNEGPPSVLQAQVRRFAQAHLMTIPNECEAPATSTAEAATCAPVPASIDINPCRQKPLAELQAMAEAVPARISGGI